MDGYRFIPIEKMEKYKEIAFCGYFQSEKYFSDMREELLKEINIEYDDLTKISDENAVCVHIRRGDYLSDTYKERFFVCDENYYKRAFERMNIRYPDAKYYIFSDDIDLVKNEMQFLKAYNVLYVSSEGEEADIKDLMMMKSCKHFIMSISSFSWWAQYLCENKDKYVLAPSRWLNCGNDNKDIYLNNWELIDV